MFCHWEQNIEVLKYLSKFHFAGWQKKGWCWPQRKLGCSRTIHRSNLGGSQKVWTLHLRFVTWRWQSRIKFMLLVSQTTDLWKIHENPPFPYHFLKNGCQDVHLFFVCHRNGNQSPYENRPVALHHTSEAHAPDATAGIGGADDGLLQPHLTDRRGIYKGGNFHGDHGDLSWRSCCGYYMYMYTVHIYIYTYIYIYIHIYIHTYIYIYIYIRIYIYIYIYILCVTSRWL